MRATRLAQAVWPAAVGLMLLSGTSTYAQQQRDGVREFVVDVGAEVAGADEPGDELPVSEFWIGVAVANVDEAVRAQLPHSEQPGVMVNEVVADSPAAKAGLRKYDVLIAVGDETLRSAKDLMRAVDKAKEAEITLRLIRQGQEQTVTVVPVKRPPREDVLIAPDDRNALFRWFEQMRPGEQLPDRLNFRLLRPGMVLPPGASFDAALPDDMTVTITKQGKEPAKIAVKRGDESWEVSQDKLDQLPADVREHVERMLGRMPLVMRLPSLPDRIRVEALPEASGAQPPGVRPSRRFTARTGGDAQQRLEKQVEDLKAELDQLRQAVEELQDRSDGEN